MKFNVEFEIDINDIVNRFKDYLYDILYDNYNINLNNTNYDALYNEIFLAVAKEIIKNNPEYKKLVNPPKEEEEFKFIFIQ